MPHTLPDHAFPVFAGMRTYAASPGAAGVAAMQGGLRMPNGTDAGRARTT